MVGPGGRLQCSVTSVNSFLVIFVIRRVLWQDFQVKDDQIFQKLDGSSDYILSEIIVNNNN